MFRLFKKKSEKEKLQAKYENLLKEAFEFLNALKLIKLAVSLGSTESLVQHPMTMTHAGVDPEHRKKINITEKMIRISVGVENAEDIINDIKQAFKAVSKKKELSLN